MNPFFTDVQKRRIFFLAATLIVVLICLFAILAVNFIKENSYIGRNPNSVNQITISGTGDVTVVPDTATFSFSVVQTDKTPGAAEDLVTKKTNDILAAIKALGVDEKDIQTTDYSVYPKYQYNNYPCPVLYDVSGAIRPCPSGQNTLIGYEVNESISVKVRKTADAGSILSKVGDLGATNISGLSFVVDNPDALQAQARDKAIADAKSKAAALAKSLGIKLDKIVNFYESGNQPIMYYDKLNSRGGMGAGTAAPVAPTIEPGQNKITSNVTITYEVD